MSEDSPRVMATARGVALVAGTMAAILFVLLAATFIQLQVNDPINSPALINLKQQLKDDPASDVLRGQVRALDLLARKAYFTGWWQIQTGGWMLLACTILLLGALKTLGLPRPRDVTLLASPEGGAAAEQRRTAARSRRILAVGGGVTMFLLIGFALFQDDPLDSPAGEAAAPVNLSEAWPGFRGPGGNGVAAVSSAPTKWDGESGEGIRWKVEVPLEGYSSPVVLNGKVFVTGADKESQAVYCYSADNGDLLWQTAIVDVVGHPSKPPRVHDLTGLAAPTASTDGRSLFVIFATGDVAGLDLDGQVLWSRNLGVPDNHYGHSSSLITHGRRLIVQYDQNSGSELLALDVDSGQTSWRVTRESISWSSPIIVDTGSREELILTNSESVDAFSPETGIKLWSVECMGGEMGPSAAFADGLVFAANDYAVAAGLRLGPEGASEALWEFDEVLPDTASPVAASGHVILAASYGVAVCLDAETGDKQWELESDYGFSASPIVVGENVYLLDISGVMRIFEIGPEYVEVAAPELGEDVTATPAFVGDHIYVRGTEHLFCIEGA